MVAVDLDRRQDVGAPPTTIGVINSAMPGESTLHLGATELAIDTSATGAPAGPVEWSFTGTTQISTEAPVETNSPAGSSTGGTESISTGTVVGACVGALVGAILLILIGLFFYKRQSRKLERHRARAAAALADNQSGKGSTREKAYKQIEEKEEFEDKWEGKNAPAGSSAAVPAVAPAVAAAAVAVAVAPVVQPQQQQQQPPTNASLEKMDMFKKAPSAISCVTDEPTFDIKDHPYSKANPSKMPEAADLLGRAPEASTLSWAESTSSSLAIPTPAAISKVHHFESAEVVNVPEPQTVQVEAARTGSRNPFFSGKTDAAVVVTPRKGSQTSLNNRSRSSSAATVQQSQPQQLQPELPSGNDIKKDRVVSIDPFNDPLPAPTFIKHQPTGSASSAASNERAIKQLVEAAGMNLSEDEVQRRLKAVSMQPSIISNSGDSMYTDADPDFDNAAAMQHFPPAPSSSGHTAR